MCPENVGKPKVQPNSRVSFTIVKIKIINRKKNYTDQTSIENEAKKQGNEEVYKMYLTSKIE